MFTVKTIINGVTHICEQPSISIARAGSETFADTLKLTHNSASPDFAYWLPAIYEDPEMTKALQEEELVISDRTDVLDTDAIAIIIEEYPSENFPGAGDGCRYQFIYPGDQVYV
ncbi:hypothetical protein OCF79_004857, partial [Salmonella enterica]|nr:hypothetical protein [Salmonella enterica subsp. enterica serovar Fluntern]ECI0553888.1 hypothetical protein [Salmonella enterica subsp. enterica]ECY6192065.1 hypothetical protein [Salmonella enterica subsp. enterica serovar Anatum]EEM8604831.1 hypothetical protein [Salmonella enterica]EHW1129334.1 hypothetical protein [Salmonella enterica subsp. enterica serovar Kinondoni]